ncbi:MAG: protein kinase [Planctomycetes bacterium]|nr:protein kinase [Planctomycetota bacterium]
MTVEQSCLDESLARELLARRILTPEQLEQARAVQRANLPAPDLASAICSGNLLSEAQVAELRRAVAALSAAGDVGGPAGVAAAAGGSPPPPGMTTWLPQAVEGAGATLKSSPAPTSTILGGEFRLDRLLGQGGMGAVYLGEQLSLKRPVAIKLLPPNVTQNAESVERFKREAQGAGRLVHPNIVQVHFFGQDAGVHFLVMEYVEGESLSARLKRDGKLSVAESARIGIQVAKALGEAHRQGLVHRDVKPDNVFLGKNGAVKLGDFGLVRDASTSLNLSATGQGMGTAMYMPPEQWEGKGVDGRSDLYALGATLFQTLSGRPPFSGSSATAIMFKHITEPAPSLATLTPDVPAELDALLRRLLEKEPGRRPAAADEVVAALEGLVGAAAPARGGRNPESPRTAVAATAAIVHERHRQAVIGVVSTALGTALLLWALQPASNPPAAVHEGARPELKDSGHGAAPGQRPTVPRASPTLAGAAVAIHRAASRGFTRELTQGERVPSVGALRFQAEEIRAGEGLRLAIQSDAPLHVYLFNIDTDGKAVCLYPDVFEQLYAQELTEGKVAGPPERNPQRPQTGAIFVPPLVRTPAGAREVRYFTADPSVGKELFLLAAAPEPIAELEELRRRPELAERGAEVKALGAKLWAQMQDDPALSVAVGAGNAGGQDQGQVLLKLSEERWVRPGLVRVRGAGRVAWWFELEHR